MERSPLRGTLAKPPEKVKLRGTLAPKESIIRGTLAGKGADSVKTPTPEGVTVSREQLPDIESLAILTGRTVIQRDGGKHCNFIELRDSLTAGRKTVKLIGGGMHYSLPADDFLASITTDGGAWRLLKK
jgi:hypothetical protein